MVPNTLVDLCSVIIMHRFSSPSWLEHLVKHVSANMSGEDGFDRVVRLKVIAAIFCTLSPVLTQTFVR